MGILRTDNISGLGGREAIKGSAYFTGADGPPGWLDVQVTDTIGSGNFTAEWWFKPKVMAQPGTANRRMLIIGHNNATGSISINWDSANNDIQFNYDDTSCISSSTIKVYSDSWYHIAVVREGTGTNETKLYINGQLSDSGTLPNNINQTNIEIGRDTNLSDDFAYYGLISNLRITKKALYTAAFTPPAYNLRALDETILLCCQDNDDPTKEATGKEIVGFGTLYYGKRYSNAATNGNLEDGATTGWANGGCATFEVSAERPHSGSYSLHCISDSNGDGVNYQATVDTSHRYKVSAYIYNISTGSARAKMKIGNSMGSSANYESQKADIGKWSYHEWIGIPVASNLYISFVESAPTPSVAEWYVDDLRVEKWYPEETENILPNPDFLDDATGWSFSSTPSGEYTISSNRLNLADTSRTGNAYASTQIHPTSSAEGRYRWVIEYNLSSGQFDIDVGGKTIYTIGGSGQVSYDVPSGSSNANFRIIGNQHCAGYFNSARLYRLSEPKRLNEVPPYGVDDGITLADNTKFDTLSYMVPPKGTTEQRSRGRGLSIGGQNNPATSKWIDYIQIQSGGIAQDFGEATDQCNQAGACSSQTRGLIARGYTDPASSNVIEYVELAVTSNALDFGDLTSQRRRPAGLSNSTRGVWIAGSGEVPSGDNYADTIDYSTIATKGDAIDFGDNTGAQISHGGAISNSTRGVYSWAYNAPAVSSVLEYLTIATTGSVATFGNLSRSHTYHFRGCSHSDSTRGIFAGGYSPVKDTIDYFTIATTGQTAADFGDLSVARRSGSGTSNSVSAVFMGGYLPGLNNIIDKVTIQATGNATDFGDLLNKTNENASCSDSHGGLS